MISSATCKICGTNNVKYICRSCMEAYCDNCIIKDSERFYVCTQCNSTNISKQAIDNNFELVCRDCGSHNISLAVKYIRKCPHCRVKVENIEDLWNKLSSTFNDLVKSFRSKIDELYELFDNLLSLKERLVFVRESGFIHDMNLDEELNDLFLKINSRTHELIKMISSISEYNLLLPTSKAYFLQQPIELLKCEKDLIQLHEIFNRIIVYIDNIANQLITSNNNMIKRLTAIEFHLKFFDRLKEYIHLDESELPICAIPDVKLIKSGYKASINGSGVLLLTFKRLIFAEEVKDSFIVPLSININDLGIEGMKISGLLSKRLQVPSKYGIIELSAELSTLEIIKNYLETAKNLGNIVKKPYVDDLYKLNINTLKLRKVVTEMIKDIRKRIDIQQIHPVNINAQKFEGELKQITTSEREYTPIDNLFKSEFGQESQINIVTENSISEEEDKILELESEKFGIQKSLELLENQWKARMISQMDYINEYNRLQAKLYKINKKLEKYTRYYK